MLFLPPRVDHMKAVCHLSKHIQVLSQKQGVEPDVGSAHDYVAIWGIATEAATSHKGESHMSKKATFMQKEQLITPS